MKWLEKIIKNYYFYLINTIIFSLFLSPYLLCTSVFNLQSILIY